MFASRDRSDGKRPKAIGPLAECHRGRDRQNADPRVRAHDAVFVPRRQDGSRAVVAAREGENVAIELVALIVLDHERRSLRKQKTVYGRCVTLCSTIQGILSVLWTPSRSCLRPNSEPSEGPIERLGTRLCREYLLGSSE